RSFCGGPADERSEGELRLVGREAQDVGQSVTPAVFESSTAAAGGNGLAGDHRCVRASDWIRTVRRTGDRRARGQNARGLQGPLRRRGVPGFLFSEIWRRTEKFCLSVGRSESGGTADTARIR